MIANRTIAHSSRPIGSLPRRLLPAAASSRSCCLGCCCHRAGSLCAVHSARTTALMLAESWCDALVKVVAVLPDVLEIVHGKPARQRHLPPRSGGLWCGLLALRGG